MKQKIISLIKLLDDDNPVVVQSVMAELLRHEQEVIPLLAEHQESDNSRLRMRIHQLQSIMTTRRRRSSFGNLLRKKHLKLIDGLIAVHLQWYDNDSERSLFKLWREILKTAKRYKPETIEQLSYFMRKCGFSVIAEDEIQADHYCLGPVLEDQEGADFILCAIALEIAAVWGLELRIVRVVGNFALVDTDGQALVPKNNWQLMSRITIQNCDFWDNVKILKLASSMLFLHAVSSDSFRYVHTIGHSLSSLIDEDASDFFPYPYAPTSDPDEPEE